MGCSESKNTGGSIATVEKKDIGALMKDPPKLDAKPEVKTPAPAVKEQVKAVVEAVVKEQE